MQVSTPVTPGRPGILPESKAHTISHERRVEIAAQELEQHIEAAFPRTAQERFGLGATEIAARLCGCLEGPILDLGAADFSEREAAVLGSLGAEVWRSVLHFAEAKGQAVTTVRVPALFEPVLRGHERLGEIAGSHLEIEVAPAASRPGEDEARIRAKDAARRALIDAMPESLVASLAPAGLDAEAFADRLLAARSGPTFDASLIDRPRVLSVPDAWPETTVLGDALMNLPAGAWRALRDDALADGVEIESIRLPKCSRLDDYQLVDGLNEIVSLAHLSLCTAPAQRELNLTGLALRKLGALDLRHEGSALAVNLPAALPPLEVRGTLTGSQAHASRVRRIDEEGEPVSDDPFALLIYARRPTDFMTDLNTGRPLTEQKAQQVARAVNLNLTVDFRDSGEGLAFPDDGDDIQCRHLVMHWLDRRDLHLQAQAEDGKASEAARFSYDGMRFEQELQQSVSLRTETKYWQTLAQGPAQLFEIEQLGAALATELRAMKDEGRAASHFLLEAGGMHAMGVELQVKPDRRSVVNLYEPNVTASHLRCAVDDPRRLEGVGLAHWSSPKMIDELFEDKSPGGSRIGALYRWQPGSPPDPASTQPLAGPSAVRVSDAHMATPQFLYHALRGGDGKAVAASVHGLLAKPDGKRSELRGDSSGRLGLQSAVFLDRHEAAGAYARALLDSKRLDASGQVEVLNTTKTQDGLLGIACTMGRPQVVEAVLVQVLKAPDVPPATRLRLLSGRGTGEAQPSALEVALARGQVDAVERYVAVLLDPANRLTPAQRVELLSVTRAIPFTSPAVPQARWAYYDAILSATDEVLPLASRQQLLGGLLNDALLRNDADAVKFHVDEVLRHPKLDAAGRRSFLGDNQVHRDAHARGHVEAIEALVSALLDAGPDGLERADLLGLLAGEGRYTMGEPALVAIVRERADSVPLHRAHEALYQRLRCICDSKALTSAEKAAIFASCPAESDSDEDEDGSGGPPVRGASATETLVRAALEDDPHAAGAIVAALAGSSCPHGEKVAICRALGPSIGVVLRKLLRSHGAGQPWTWKILGALDQCGLSESDALRYHQQITPLFLKRARALETRA